MKRWMMPLGLTAAALLVYLPLTGRVPGRSDVEGSQQPPSGGVSVLPATYDDAAAMAPDAVTVEHELVAVVPINAAPRQTRARGARRPILPRAAIPAGTPASATLGSKASRLLLGDGRYRPEPFPRPTD